MNTTDNNNYKFEGPYGRYYRATYILENPDNFSTDPWINKLLDILKLEKYYNSQKNGRDRFLNECPLYFKLIETFRNDGEGSDKDILEACLLATNNYREIETTLNIPRFNELFIKLYKELFYDVDTIIDNEVLFARYILQPLLSVDSNKIPLGKLWKLLATSGGLKLLVSKGMGTTPIRPEDIGAIFQMCSLRNCQMLLSYASEGASMWADGQNHNDVLSIISEFETVRSPERHSCGFTRVLTNTAGIFSNLLDGGVKLISMPKNLDESIFSADGVFHPEMKEAIEEIKHINIEE